MKIRVSQLAGELRCKANDILTALPGLGIKHREPITPNSRLEAEEVDKVRKHFVANPVVKEHVDHVTHGLAKSIAARFGEEI